MLRSIFAKAIRDRWVGVVVASASLAAIDWMGAAAYKTVGRQVMDAFSAFPQAFLKVMGVDPAQGATGMVFGEMAQTIAPLVLCGLMIAMGADAVAGEERWGTAGLLLANPRSRTRLVVEKAAAMVAMIAVGSVLVWGGYWASLALVGEHGTGMFLGSATIHLAAAALFFGGLAFVIGAFTANTTKAVGWTTAVMLVSFFAAGLLPLTSWGGSWVKIFPWYYLNGARPFFNGVVWGHVAVLAGVGLALLVAAAHGFRSRDLQVGETRTSVVERALRNPRIAKYAEKIAGRAVVGSITAKTTSEAQAMLAIAGGGLFYMTVLLGPIFKGVGSKMGELAAAFPKQIMAMVGGADYSRPEGYFHGEIFSIVAPVAVAVVAISMSARALAGEERDRTMGLLLANPVSRARVVLAKTGGMVLMVSSVAAITYVGMIFGNLIGQLGMSYTNMAAACVHLAAFGVFIGCFALLVSAATGLSRVVTATGTVLVTVAYAISSFFPLNPAWAPWARVSPFYYYSHHLPLDHGFAWGYLGVLVGASAVLVAGSVWAFERRDLRG